MTVGEPSEVEEVAGGRVTGHIASGERVARRSGFALDGLSNPDQFGEVAERLGDVFPDFTLEVFAERRHFDPPHRTESPSGSPSRSARSGYAAISRHR
jgi:hypothetical protein